MASDDEAIVAEIKSLEARRCAALVACDVAALDDLLAPDAAVYHGTGSIERRNDFLGNLLDRLEISRAEIRDETYRISNDVAVVHGFYEMTVRQKRKPGTGFYPATALMTSVWHRRDGRWEHVLLHQTRVPPDLSPQ